MCKSRSHPSIPEQFYRWLFEMLESHLRLHLLHPVCHPDHQSQHYIVVHHTPKNNDVLHTAREGVVGEWKYNRKSYVLLRSSVDWKCTLWLCCLVTTIWRVRIPVDKSKCPIIGELLYHINDQMGGWIKDGVRLTMRKIIYPMPGRLPHTCNACAKAITILSPLAQRFCLT